MPMFILNVGFCLVTYSNGILTIWRLKSKKISPKCFHTLYNEVFVRKVFFLEGHRVLTINKVNQITGVLVPKIILFILSTLC